MNPKLSYTEILKYFLNTNWNMESSKGFELNENEGERVTEILIHKLDSKETSIWNIASHMIT